MILFNNYTSMNDHELIMLCSLRYGLGRMTYITRTISDYIIKQLPHSSKKFKIQVIREIDECENLGMDCDKEAWMTLKESALEHIEIENKWLEWGESSTGKYAMDKNEVIINELTGFLFSFSGTKYNIPHDEIIKKLKSLL